MSEKVYNVPAEWAAKGDAYDMVVGDRIRKR